MKQSTLRQIILNAFQEGWHERNRRPLPDGTLTSIVVDEEFERAEEKIVSYWIAELSKDADL